MSSRLSPNGTAQRTGPAPRLGQALRAVFGVSPPDSVLPPGLLAVLREEEIRDQLTAIRREAPIRAMAVLLIGWISLIYLPPLFTLLFVPATFLCDQFEMRLIKASLVPPARPALHRAAIGLVCLAEMIFCLPSAVLWQSEDPFSKIIGPATNPPTSPATAPVIAMTADASEHDRQDYLQAGLDGYLAKPIELGRIRAELQRVLTRRP